MNPPSYRRQAERRHECAEAVLEIDLGAIAANRATLANRLAPHVQLAAVIKADGYGLGATEAGQALRKAGCTRFFVATLGEGIALRAALADASNRPAPEILILNGLLPGCAAELHAHRLIPVLNSADQIADWVALARSLGFKLPAALHIDTGMSRLGVSLAEAGQYATNTKQRQALDLILVMSHLACADEPDHPQNRTQLERFRSAITLFPGVPASLAASSGIALGPDFHFDWVRPGAALYGVNPAPGQPNPMCQVVRLQAKILQVRDVDEGGSVGYGATFRAARRTKVAVVAAGYADGLFRSLSNRGFGSLGGIRVPLIGRVSMDLTIFDVTKLPASLAQAGGSIELLGPDCTVDDIAAAAGTNGYEVLTSLGSRAVRIYRENGFR